MHLPSMDPLLTKKSLADITEEQSSKRKSTMNQTMIQGKGIRDGTLASPSSHKDGPVLVTANSQLSINEMDEHLESELNPSQNFPNVPESLHLSNKDNCSSSQSKLKDVVRENKARVTFLFAEQSNVGERLDKVSYNLVSPTIMSHKSFKSSLSGIAEIEAPNKHLPGRRSKPSLSKQGSNRSIGLHTSMNLNESKPIPSPRTHTPSGFQRRRKDNRGLDYTRIEFPKFGVVLEDDPYKKEFQNKLDKLKQLTSAGGIVGK
jgi:hypothetical protein